jgi:serine/threonine protein kinase
MVLANPMSTIGIDPASPGDETPGNRRLASGPDGPTAADTPSGKQTGEPFESRPSESPTHLVERPDSGARRLRASVGEIVGDYTLVAPIAHGGMGEVWEAVDGRLRRTVALKLIRPDKLTDDLRGRFITESQAQARLHHDGIAQIFQADTEAERPFIAMELIRGAQRLDLVLKHQRLPVVARLDLLRKIADAVAHAHQQHVIHLDLKPSNILVRADGQPKILDFGGGRITDAPFSESDVAIATPQYMSPEQATLDLRRVDERSDIYALGVIAHELFEGSLPYDLAGKTFSEVCDEICGPHAPKALTRLAGAARQEIGAVVGRALEKKPEARYQSMADFRDDLAALLDGTTVSVTPNGWTTRARRWLRDDQHVPRSGYVLSIVSWLIAAVCVWFMIVAAGLPDVRAMLIPQVRTSEFLVHESQWVALLTALGFCGRHAARRRPAPMWVVLVAVVALNVFALSVVSGRFAYDAGGTVADPLARTMLFTLFSGIGLVSLLLTLLMLTSHYVRAPWHAVPGSPVGRRGPATLLLAARRE